MKRISITGFSTTVFGVSWEYCKTEKDYINSIFNFLYGRRVLFASFGNEEHIKYIPSIISIKNYITDVICQFDFSKENKEFLFKLIDICNDALDNIDYIINNMYKPADCLAEELLGYGFIEMRTILEPFRQEFYKVIEKLEKENKLVFPNKKGSFYNIECNEPINAIIDDIINNRYTEEVSNYLFKLIKHKQLVNFLEVYKPFFFSKLFVQFDSNFQLLLIKHINDNYDKSSKNKMMKKYDIFAFIASQILKDEIIPSNIKVIAKEIIYKSAKHTPSSIELLTTDSSLYFARKNR